MQKLREKIESKDQWRGLLQYVDPLEANIDQNNNIVLDNSKSLLESLSKTIIRNKGEKVQKDDFAKIVKQALCTTPVYMALGARDQQGVLKIVSAICNIATSIGEFRNAHGFFSHGNDIHGEQFDLHITHLIIDSTESLALFLINAHSQDLYNRKRFHYDDYPDFNAWYDEKESLEIEGAIYSASEALFKLDETAYRDKLLAFENDPEALVESLHDSEFSERTLESLENMRSVLNIDQLERIRDFLEDQKKITEDLNRKLVSSGVQENLHKFSEAIRPQLESIKGLAEKVNEHREYIKNDLRDEIIEEHIEDLKGQQQLGEWRDGQ